MLNIQQLVAGSNLNTWFPIKPQTPRPERTAAHIIVDLLRQHGKMNADEMVIRGRSENIGKYSNVIKAVADLHKAGTVVRLPGPKPYSYMLKGSDDES